MWVNFAPIPRVFWGVGGLVGLVGLGLVGGGFGWLVGGLVQLLGFDQPAKGYAEACTAEIVP